MTYNLKTFSRNSQDYQKIISELKLKQKRTKLFETLRGETNNGK